MKNSEKKFVKADSKQIFEQMTSEGCVDGVIVYGPGKEIPVYVELGKEREYTPRDNEDKKTPRRFFVGCIVYFAQTKQRRDEGVFLLDYTIKNIPVVIYY